MQRKRKICVARKEKRDLRNMQRKRIFAEHSNKGDFAEHAKKVVISGACTVRGDLRSMQRNGIFAKHAKKWDLRSMQGKEIMGRFMRHAAKRYLWKHAEERDVCGVGK